jgi:hypothetical protein
VSSCVFDTLGCTAVNRIMMMEVYLLSVYTSFVTGNSVKQGLEVLRGGRTIAQTASRWLPPSRLGFAPGSGQVGFVMDKVALGQVFSKFSVSPANLHSTDCSAIIIVSHLGLVQ